MKKYYFIYFIVIFISNLFSVYHRVGGIGLNLMQDIEIQDNIAVASTHSQEIQFFDLSCVSNPEMISSISLNDTPRELELCNSFCYTVVRDTSIVIIDFSDIQNPTYIIEFSFSSEDICEFIINDDIIYIYNLYELIIVSVQDPLNPELISLTSINNPYYQTYGSQYENDRLYISTQTGLRIYDVSNPTNPFYVNSFGDDIFWDFQVIDNIAYLGNEDGLFILNVENYYNIQILCENTDYDFRGIFVDNDNLYSLASLNNIQELYHFDIQDINNFITIGTYSGGLVIKVENDLVYTRSGGWESSEFDILDFSDPYNQYFVGNGNLRCDRKEIDVKNNLLAVCSRDNDQVSFFDLANPENPEQLYNINNEQQPTTVTLCDNFSIIAFLGTTYGNSRLYFHDISDPNNIELISIKFLETSRIYRIAVKENYAYIGGRDKLFVLDINDLTATSIVYCIEDVHVRDIVIRDDFLYTCTNGDFRIYDITNPENPFVVGTWESMNFTEAVNVYDNYAYVSDWYGGLKVLNVSNPTDPYLVNTILPHFDSLIQAKPIIHDNKLIISDIYWSELLVYDLTNPAFPALVNSFKWNRVSAELASNEDYLITANYYQGFTILDLENLTPVSENIITKEKISLTNYPNPFNPTTTINFSIQNDSKINLSIYNIKGQKIKVLAQNEFSKGSHSVIWNGNDEYGKIVSSGIYYYKLNVNGKTEAVRRCLLLK